MKKNRFLKFILVFGIFISSLSVSVSAVTKKQIETGVALVSRYTLANQDLLTKLRKISKKIKHSEEISDSIKECSKNYNLALNTKDQLDNLSNGLKEKKKIKKKKKLLKYIRKVFDLESDIEDSIWDLYTKLGINLKSRKLNEKEKKMFDNKKGKEFIFDLKDAYDDLNDLISDYVESIED